MPIRAEIEPQKRKFYQSHHFHQKMGDFEKSRALEAKI